MKYTVVFGTHDSVDLSYGLLFTPYPGWYRGNQMIIDLNPGHTAYQKGSVLKLINKEPILSSLFENMRASTVVIHPTGKGTFQDLRNLITDLKDVGFTVNVVAFNGVEPYDITVSI